MISTKTTLPINDLQVGMRLASDIVFENKVLLAKDVKITESLIKRLKQNYIVDKIEVYLEKDFNEISTLKFGTVKEIENVFNEFSSNLEYIFNNIFTLKAYGMDEVRAYSKKIQDEFKATGSVIRNVIFYGSGNDTIFRHSVNVTAISFILGKWLEFNDRELNLLTYSAILHDFGKMKIDKSILNKTSGLTSEEYKTFNTHPVIGYNFVKKIPYLDDSVSYAVLMHHEKSDGTGYPLHIKGDKIHKFAKIIAIADLFDEVSSNRYSKKIRGPFEALKIIQDEGLRKLDCVYCGIFLNHIINYYMGENVLLNNERSCKVIQVEINNLTKPLLLDNNEFLDLKKEKGLYVTKLVI